MYEINQDKLNRNKQIALNIKKIIIILLMFILLANLAILLDIPLLRLSLGYIYITFLPGFAIFLLSSSNRGYEISDIILFSTGLSLSFVMIIFFVHDYILHLILGIQFPLSFGYVLLSLNICTILMLLATWLIKLEMNFIINYDLLRRNDCLMFTLASLFPLLAIIGVFHLGERDNAYIYFLVCLIFLYIFLLGFMNVRISDLTCVYIIFTISFSLLILVFFRTGYIYASDAVYEYFLFNTVLDGKNYYEFRNAYDNLGMCLSITVLPVIYSIITDLPNNILFKSIYILPLSLTPIITYKISRILLSRNLSFISSIFLISQGPFLYQIAAFRTYLSILFFSMAIFALFTPMISRPQQRLICIVLLFSGIVSHYANTIIVITILILFYILSKMLNYFNNIYYLNKNFEHFISIISVKFIFLLVVFLFFWYAQITENAFNNAILFVSTTFNRLYDFYLLETQSVEMSAAMGSTLKDSPTPIITYVVFIINWISILFIATGITFSLLNIFRIGSLMLNNPVKYILKNTGNNVTSIVLMSSICAFIFGMSVFLPYIYQGYSLGRTYYQMVVLLSIFFTIGGIVFAKYLLFPIKFRHWIVYIVLIIYFANSLGVLHELNQRPSAVILNPPQTVKDPRYTYEVEVSAVEWAKLFCGINASYYSDRYGYDKIIQIGLIDKKNIDRTKLFQNDSTIELGYIYLTYDNTVKHVIYERPPGIMHKEHELSSIINYTTRKNTIYVNGGSSILC